MFAYLLCEKKFIILFFEHYASSPWFIPLFCPRYDQHKVCLFCFPNFFVLPFGGTAQLFFLLLLLFIAHFVFVLRQSDFTFDPSLHHLVPPLLFKFCSGYYQLIRLTFIYFAHPHFHPSENLIFNSSFDKHLATRVDNCRGFMRNLSSIWLMNECSTGRWL